MANTGNKKKFFLFFFCCFFLASPIIGETEKVELKELLEKSAHEKMLSHLNYRSTPEESFLRRGEIIFFVSFGYIYMYQFIMYDQIFPSAFGEKEMKGELRDRNLYFGLFTSLILAAFISRNDLQRYHFFKKGEPYYFSHQKNDAFIREKKGYNWYFPLFSWEF